MKIKITNTLLLAFLISFTFSCNNSNEDIYGEDVEVDGSGIEMTFKEINEDGDIVVTIANHMESDLNEFYVKAIWLDENGNTFEGFGGEADYFPFQQIDRGMIKSGKKNEFTTMMNVEMDKFN
ncbi:MAG: hypothetical protein C0596_18730 [Marinilabiliales bacterium]|nr:MAG: hypothetical protein C0596_18730 [Marinilabiliales bacterium]